ncbi:hypothetical protein CONLIGDRAFT_684980 [Coniochaeta ligniaria NRRL 30616]|uniref:Uncharacterized protein n=1 Tax=Coniochaeta ligniaria NRRL 30616 TaxID=1408157 RepID=A0A1J7ICF2_9PEZI|nr:hypothetical protein CONLIGDRAFT_684980 [Coniochaeta ligniaria NRRL 30616]
MNIMLYERDLYTSPNCKLSAVSSIRLAYPILSNKPPPQHQPQPVSNRPLQLAVRILERFWNQDQVTKLRVLMETSEYQERNLLILNDELDTGWSRPEFKSEH